MIIETHSHLDVGLCPPEAGRTHYGAAVDGVERYLETYRACGVDACWTFGALAWSRPELAHEENRRLAELGRRHPAVLHPWGSVNPFWPEPQLRSEIRFLAESGLNGIKLSPVIQGCSLASGSMDILADEAERRGLPVFFHDGSAEYCSPVQVAGFARAHPGLAVVSGHAGLRELWREYAETAGSIPNLWLCLSGPTQQGIQALYDRLGPDRLFFGSDGGLGTPMIIRAYLLRLERLRAPDAHKRMIMGENAARFMREHTPHA